MQTSIAELPTQSVPALVSLEAANYTVEEVPEAIPTKETVVVRGQKEVVLSVPVDDNVYCMQDKYHRPYTTVDKEGNTTVSIVEDVVVNMPDNNTMVAELRVKLFKNETIEVVPQIDPLETCPIKTNFVQRTLQSIEHDLLRVKVTASNELVDNLDEYDRTVKNTLHSYVDSAVTSLTYRKVRDWAVTCQTSSTKTNYLRPYKTYANTSTTWMDWDVDSTTDSTYNHHLRYWYGKDKSCDFHDIKPVTVLDRMRDILQSRRAPAVIRRHTPVYHTTDKREIRARQTLRRLIGNDSYNRYLCRGFITYKGASGRVYQIFPGHQRVKVWEKNKCIEEMCVVLTGDFPPTDSLMMRFLLIQESEERFRGVANVSPSYAPGNARKIETPAVHQPLVDVFKKLKQDHEDRDKLKLFTKLVRMSA